MEIVRTFVAVELPQQVKDDLVELRRELSKAGQDVVRWVSIDGMHLTLKFLGEIPVDSVPQATAALEEAARGMAPFVVETGDLGFFPNSQRPRVFWIGLKGCVSELLRLKDNVEVALEALGFPREAREFSPHLTLARFKDMSSPEERRRFAEKAASVKLPESRRIPVEALSLMRSTLRPEGAAYSRLAHLPLRA